MSLDTGVRRTSKATDPCLLLLPLLSMKSAQKMGEKFLILLHNVSWSCKPTNFGSVNIITGSTNKGESKGKVISKDNRDWGRILGGRQFRGLSKWDAGQGQVTGQDQVQCQGVGLRRAAARRGS